MRRCSRKEAHKSRFTGVCGYDRINGILRRFTKHRVIASGAAVMA